MAEKFDPYYRWLGIPPEEQPPNYYRLLGVTVFENQADVIEAAADRQMGYLRTFQTGSHASLSQRLLNEVATARVCLLSPQKRAEYDAKLRETIQPSTAAATKQEPPSVFSLGTGAQPAEEAGGSHPSAVSSARGLMVE